MEALHKEVNTKVTELTEFIFGPGKVAADQAKILVGQVYGEIEQHQDNPERMQRRIQKVFKDPFRLKDSRSGFLYFFSIFFKSGMIVKGFLLTI